jgi:hypothetical protein
VFGPAPEYDAPLPRPLAYSIASNQPNLAKEHLVADGKLLDAETPQTATKIWRVPYTSLYDEICGADSCLEYADPAQELPLMADDNHLSAPSASFVVKRLVDGEELD